jgi:hypothetical protein
MIRSSSTPQLLASPDFFSAEFSTTASTCMPVLTEKRLPSPRVDSGIGPRRSSSVYEEDERGGLQDKNEKKSLGLEDLAVVNEKLVNPRDSGRELKDWLALSRMLDNI